MDDNNQSVISNNNQFNDESINKSNKTSFIGNDPIALSSYEQNKFN